jgi:DegV family protein with EDD domain
MPRVAIITDSTACLPKELVEQLQIRVIPLFIEFEDAVYEDGLPGTAAAFYEKLASAPNPPTTGAPSLGAYADAMVEAGESVDAVLCITVASQFSGMHQAALQGMALARERAPDLDVHVLDSGSAAMAQGFVVLEAARMAQSGAGLDAVLGRAREVMARVQLLISLDTLTYLGRSGRVLGLLAWASSPLRLKPLVSFSEGRYRPIGFARSTAKAIESLVRALEQRTQEGKLHLAVHHTNAPHAAARLAERASETLQPAELVVCEFTQLMGVHTGPGLLGFAFFIDS